MVDAREHIGPPMQADFAGQRLAYLLAHPGNLGIESIQREQRATQIRWHKQRGSVADKIMGAHQIGAEAFGAAGVRTAHGTAIKAAATRRRSPIMML